MQNLLRRAIERPYKVIIWGCGNTYNFFSDDIQREAENGRIEIIGFTGSNTIVHSIDGYRFIQKKDLCNTSFDYIIAAVLQDSYPDICNEAKGYGISREQFIRADVFGLYGFNFERYLKLRINPVSIISKNCFGGILYNHLDLPFTSPTINMWFTTEDFIRFCNDLPRYLEIEPEIDYMQYEPFLKFYYPVVALDNVRIHFNHYSTFGEGNEKWNERRAKINFNNILVVMWAEDDETLEGFQNIPYRKVCFTPYKTDIKDTYYLPVEIGKEMWEMTNNSAIGSLPSIDRLKLMLGEPDFMRCVYR